MKARIIADSPKGVSEYLTRLEQEQNEDGVAEVDASKEQ
jgi:hypothetical protein